MSRNSLVRRAVLGLLFIALVALGVFAGTRAGSRRFVSVRNPSSELSQDRPATAKIAGEPEADAGFDEPDRFSRNSGPRGV